VLALENNELESPPAELIARGSKILLEYLLQVTRSVFISHKAFSKALCKSQFPHKSVNLLFTITD